MRRLVHVVENMMENQKKYRKRSGKQPTNDQKFIEEFDQYPFFVHAVKVSYFIHYFYFFIIFYYFLFIFLLF